MKVLVIDIERAMHLRHSDLSFMQLKKFQWRSLIYGKLMENHLRRGSAHLLMHSLVIVMTLF